MFLILIWIHKIQGWICSITRMISVPSLFISVIFFSFIKERIVKKKFIYFVENVMKHMSKINVTF